MDSSPTNFGVTIVYTEKVQDGEIIRSPDVSIDEVQDSFAGTGTGQAAKGKHRAERTGIPITVTKVEEQDLGCSEGSPMQQKTLSNIPAGVDVTCVDAGNGSLTAGFRSDEDGYGWIISGHVAGGELGGASGTEVRQGEVGKEQKIGVVRNSQVNADIDWAFVEDTEGTKAPVAEVAQPDDMSSTDYVIGGITTDDTLANKAGSNETFYTQGVQTSRIANVLIGVGGVNGTSYVTSEHDTTDGDSGGILFGVGPNDEYAYVAGTIKSGVNEDNDGDDCPDDTKSTTAETVENKANGYFIT